MYGDDDTRGVTESTSTAQIVQWLKLVVQTRNSVFFFSIAPGLVMIHTRPGLSEIRTPERAKRKRLQKRGRGREGHERPTTDTGYQLWAVISPL